MNSSCVQVRISTAVFWQPFSSSPLSQSCSKSQRQRFDMQVPILINLPYIYCRHKKESYEPSLQRNSVEVQLLCFLGQFSSSDQSPQSLSPSHLNRIKTHLPPGPPIPPNDPRHLNSPSGQFGIGVSQFNSSDASEQSGSPSH